MYKVMIADDEPFIRKGIMCLINWSELNCEVVYEAVNGMDAKDYLESNSADIVISDIKMPKMNGIQLSKYIYETYPHVKVIILTAFADFSYAQSAIKYNVVDFIVKTSYAEKIPEAVCNAINLISKEKENKSKLTQLENTIGENVTEIREKLIKDIINGIIIDSKIIDNRLIDLKLELKNYYLMTYEINYTNAVTQNCTAEEHNKFIISVKNFLSLALKDYYNLTIIMNKNTLITIVSFKNNNSAACIQLLLKTCSEIMSMVEGFMRFTVRIGLSGMHHSIDELLDANIESQEALSSNFYNDNNVSVYIKHSSMSSEFIYIPLNQYVDEFTNCLKLGSYQGSLDTIMKLFDDYKKNKEPIEQVKISSMLLCSTSFRLLANYNLLSNDYIKSEMSIYKQIEDSKSLKSLTDILINVINSTTELITSSKKQDNYLVKEVNKYIYSNYNKAINLQSIADHVHVNNSYLSSLYKKETGESLIDVLNKYRVEIAKKLLRDPSKKIFEVASAVGIEDPAYFTNVFTKYVGISPKEFRSKT